MKSRKDYETCPCLDPEVVDRLEYGYQIISAMIRHELLLITQTITRTTHYSVDKCVEYSLSSLNKFYQVYWGHPRCRFENHCFCIFVVRLSECMQQHCTEYIE